VGGINDGKVHVPEVLVPFPFYCNVYLDGSVLFTGLLLFFSSWALFINSLLVSAPNQVMKDSENDVDGKGGSDLGNYDSLVVVEIFDIVECAGNGHRYE
jgi:hypothetical protein